MKIDIDKPVQLRNVNDNSIRACRVITAYSHGIIIAHDMSGSYPGYWNANFDGSFPDRIGSPWVLENVSPPPVTYTAYIVWRRNRYTDVPVCYSFNSSSIAEDFISDIGECFLKKETISLTV